MTAAATAALDARPVLVPAGGLGVNPEPEEASPTEQVEASIAMSALLGMLGVPEGLIQTIEVAHHGHEAMAGDRPVATPQTPRISAPTPNVSPTAFRPQDAFRPRGA